MQYIIHTCQDRLWYVEEYLLPSMLEQGILRENISIYVDRHNLGNLEACMKIFQAMPNDKEHSWHLQDDSIISDNFKEITERQYEEDIICAFASKYDKAMPGKTDVFNMWWSFQCIRIPNNIAHKCAKWFYDTAVYDKEYQFYVRQRKFDDLIFQRFIQEQFPKLSVLNLAPNLVNHIDWLIGGSQCNKQREDIVLSQYWENNDIILDLKEKLKNDE